MSNQKESIASATRDAIAQASGGSDSYTRHALNRKVLMTNGVIQMAEAAGAHWLCDEIALRQETSQVKSDPMLQEMQFWRLELNTENSGAKLHCDRDMGDTAFTVPIEFTDFPLPEGVKVWFANGVMYLPCEH